MVMTALVLAVVGVLAAVTSVLSAQQQSVTSSLQVSYVANNVSATVSVASKTQSGTFSTPSASNPVQTVTFNPSDGNSSTAALVANNVALGGFSDETFQRYAVYKFSFTNNYTSGHGTKMSVTMNYSAPTGENNSNVTLLWIAATDDTEPSVSVSNNAWNFTNTPKHVQLTASASTNVFVNSGSDGRVPQGTTYHVYLYVLVTDTTLPSSFVLSSSNLTFNLNGAA
jgi:hypothetical protein